MQNLHESLTWATLVGGKSSPHLSINYYSYGLWPLCTILTDLNNHSWQAKPANEESLVAQKSELGPFFFKKNIQQEYKKYYLLGCYFLNVHSLTYSQGVLAQSDFRYNYVRESVVLDQKITLQKIPPFLTREVLDTDQR